MNLNEKPKSVRLLLQEAGSKEQAELIYAKATEPGCTASPRTLRRWAKEMKRWKGEAK